MASSNLVFVNPAMILESEFDFINLKRVCPVFPCAFDYKERRFKKLLSTLTLTMKSMFLPVHRGESLEKKVELLELALGNDSKSDRDIKVGGISLDDVCGFYLRQLFLSLITTDEENRIVNLSTSSISSEEYVDASEEEATRILHPAYELYENFRIVFKKFPQAARYIGQDGLSLLHHLTLFYTSNVDRRYKYHALDEENATLFRVVQMLVRLAYVSAPNMATMFAKTERGFATPMHIMMTSSNNNSVDYELLQKMLGDNPTAASQEYLNGRMMLHLLLSSIPHEEKELEWYLVLLKMTLSTYPEAAFKSVYEEMRFLRVNEVPEGVDQGTFQTFSMQVRKIDWSPVQKAKEIKNTKVQQVFSTFLAAISWERLKSQVHKR